MLKKVRKTPKMSVDDIDRVIAELDAWRRGERAGRLTWKRLEATSGFTRQALSAKDTICEAYGQIKAATRTSRGPRPCKTDQQQLDDLRREIDRLKSVIARYDERWIRWTRNATLLGYDLDRLNEPLEPPARSHTRVVRSNGRKHVRGA